MALIPYETYKQASQNWRTFWNKEAPEPRVVNPFLGFNPWMATWGIRDETVEVPLETISRFEMLASPHYATIIRAWCILEGVSLPEKNDLTTANSQG